MEGLHPELALGLIGCDQPQTAPFVAKTYQMVCDTRTDALIRWGKENNSFVIVDPTGFSQFLLPCFFKHNNFSSFIRQLNTYGFRKVHPDRWEFAHEAFLRGQTHLLPSVVRRKKRGEGASCSFGGGGDDQPVVSEEEEREALFEEVQSLRREQASIGQELARMSRRLQVTERRPDQLMSFLARLAEDPDAVTGHLIEQTAEKKRRRMQLSAGSAPPLAPLPPPLLALGGAAIDEHCRWMDPEEEQKPFIVPAIETGSGVQQVPEFGGTSGISLSDGETAVETPFPFCLLGQGFF